MAKLLSGSVLGGLAVLGIGYALTRRAGGAPGGGLALYTNFSQIYSLNDGQTSPDGKIRCVYKSAGICESNGTALILQSADDAFFAGLAAGDTTTTRSVNVQCAQFSARNIHGKVTMATQKQMRSKAPPNSWETAWVWLKYVDNHHHYYFTIKSNNQWEFGKKDYLPGETGDHQIFLRTGTLPAELTWAIGRQYTVESRVEGNNISIKVNGIDIMLGPAGTNTTVFIDDGRTGRRAQTADLAKPGTFGCYVEDARATFDDIFLEAL